MLSTHSASAQRSLPVHLRISKEASGWSTASRGKDLRGQVGEVRQGGVGLIGRDYAPL